MSIAQKQPKGTLTEPSRALALFTDRTDALRLFAGRTHADPAVEKVIFFYGDGGNGKTLLLRWLQANACKLLPPRTWERVRAIGDDAAFRRDAGGDRADPGNRGRQAVERGHWRASGGRGGHRREAECPRRAHRGGSADVQQ